MSITTAGERDYELIMKHRIMLEFNISPREYTMLTAKDRIELYTMIQKEK